MPTRAGDQLLTDLVARRSEALTRYAYLFTGDVAAAQDLVQDALVRVFVRTRSGFHAEFAEAYVRRAIAHLYIDHHRRRRQWARAQHLLLRAETGGDPDDSVPLRMDVRAALTDLAPRERAVVVLRYFGDLTVPEIADQLGLAQGSIKRYLSNALGKLERTLGPMPTLRAERTETSPVALATGEGRR